MKNFCIERASSEARSRRIIFESDATEDAGARSLVARRLAARRGGEEARREDDTPGVVGGEDPGASSLACRPRRRQPLSASTIHSFIHSLGECRFIHPRRISTHLIAAPPPSSPPSAPSHRSSSSFLPQVPRVADGLEEDPRGVPCLSWHPTSALLAASCNKRVFLLDGATGAVTDVLRLPAPATALAHAPARLNGVLVVMLHDGSVHAVDRVDGAAPPALRRLHHATLMNAPPLGGSADQRRGHLAFSERAAAPWVVFAAAGDKTLRAAPLRAGNPGYGGGDLLRLKNEHKRPIACLAGLPSQGVVVAGYVDGQVRAYDVVNAVVKCAFRLNPILRAVSGHGGKGGKKGFGWGKTSKKGSSKSGGTGGGVPAPTSVCAFAKPGRGEDRPGACVVVVGDAGGRLSLWPIDEPTTTMSGFGSGGGGGAEVRSISHWFPYDRVGVVNADPQGLYLPAHLSAHPSPLSIPTHLDAFQLRF